MRPRRNRGESIRNNRMKKFVVLRIWHEHIDAYGASYYNGEYYPVVVKRGSFDPRTRCADPSATDWNAVKKILGVPQSEYVDVFGLINDVEAGILDMNIEYAHIPWYYEYRGYDLSKLYQVVERYDYEVYYRRALDGDDDEDEAEKLAEWFENHTASYYTGDYYGFR